VPLEQYKQNLKTIITLPLLREHAPKIIVMTPPPIDERMCEAWDLAQGIDQVRRRAEAMKAYADAAKEASEEVSVACLDLWSVFMRKLVGRPGLL